MMIWRNLCPMTPKKRKRAKKEQGEDEDKELIEIV
jgi:hypothetical protein